MNLNSLNEERLSSHFHENECLSLFPQFGLPSSIIPLAGISDNALEFENRDLIEKRTLPRMNGNYEKTRNKQSLGSNQYHSLSLNNSNQVIRSILYTPQSRVIDIEIKTNPKTKNDSRSKVPFRQENLIKINLKGKTNDSNSKSRNIILNETFSLPPINSKPRFIPKSKAKIESTNSFPESDIHPNLSDENLKTINKIMYYKNKIRLPYNDSFTNLNNNLDEDLRVSLKSQSKKRKAREIPMGNLEHNSALIDDLLYVKFM